MYTVSYLNLFQRVKLLVFFISMFYPGGAPTRDGHDGACGGFDALSGDLDDVGSGTDVKAGGDSP
jgi:hypothetical protein